VLDSRAAALPLPLLCVSTEMALVSSVVVVCTL